MPSFFSNAKTRLAASAFVAGLVVGASSIGLAADVMGSAVFADVPAGSYFDAAVGRMNAAGIIKGFPDGKFKPSQFVTRAEVAVMLDRALNGSDEPSAPPAPSEPSAPAEPAQPSEPSTPPTQASSRSRRSSSSRSSASSATPTTSDAGAFRFAVASFNISEGARLSVSIIRSGGKKGAVSVRYELVNGTAVAGTDFSGSSGEVKFADGETTKIISVNLINDLVGEANRTFTINLSEPTGGAVLGTPSSTVVTILDDDGGAGTAAGSSSTSVAAVGSDSSAAGGAISFNAGAFSVSEKGGSITITVKRTGSTSAAANVNYAAAGGSATSGTHYNQTSGTLNFLSGESTKTFTVTVADNSAIEGNKTVNLTLSNPTGGAVLEAPASAMLSIVDDDAGLATGSGAIQFSTDVYTVSEGVGNAVVTVERKIANTGTVTISFNTGDGSAVAGADYKSVSQTLTFLPGEMSKLIGVPIIKDSLTEADEHINLTLGSLSGPATIGSPSTATLRIAGQ